MRKIPSELENPLDNLCCYFAELFSEYFNKMSFTPNMLTTISLIIGIFSIIFYNEEKYSTSSLLFLISFFFLIVLMAIMQENIIW